MIAVLINPHEDILIYSGDDDNCDSNRDKIVEDEDDCECAAGRSRGNPAQNDRNLAQSLFPR